MRVREVPEIQARSSPSREALRLRDAEGVRRVSAIEGRDLGPLVLVDERGRTTCVMVRHRHRRASVPGGTRGLRLQSIDEVVQVEVEAGRPLQPVVLLLVLRGRLRRHPARNERMVKERARRLEESWGRASGRRMKMRIGWMWMRGGNLPLLSEVNWTSENPRPKRNS